MSISCSKEYNLNNKDYYLKNTSYIELRFFRETEDRLNNNYKNIIFKSKTEVNKIINFIIWKEGTATECAIIGELIFFNKSKLIINKMDIILECCEVQYWINNEHFSKAISDEGCKIIKHYYDKLVP